MVPVGEVVPGRGDLDEPLKRVPHGALAPMPEGLEDLVDLEEEPLRPQRFCLGQRPLEGICTPGGDRGKGRVQGAVRMVRHGLSPWGVDREELARPEVDEVQARQETTDLGRGSCIPGGREPAEGLPRRLAVECSEGEAGEGIAKR